LNRRLPPSRKYEEEDYMKKLIAIAVVFALVSGVAFAVDVGGTVFGLINVVQGSSVEDSDIMAGGYLKRVRFDGSGEVADGAFGGYIRLNWDENGGGMDSANAWWKPIDQFKLLIGRNSDGIWGKEGVTGWMFNQMPYDGGVAENPGIWFHGTQGWASTPFFGGFFMCNRYAFFEGVNENALLLEIKPIDIIGINLGVPFIGGGNFDRTEKFEDILKGMTAQLDVNLDFGNIAITYAGGGPFGGRSVIGDGGGAGNGAIFAYFGGSFGDLGLDVGFAYHMAGEDEVAMPIGIGLGVKYTADAFGIKFRTTFALGGDDELTYINVSVLPYYAINDNISAFLNAGLGIVSGDGDSVTGFYVNPYIRVGAEWGPSFYAGLQIKSDGVEGADGKAVTKFAVPIGIQLSF